MRRIAALIASVSLAGCAAPPRAPAPYVAPDPAAFHSWVASGRMAVAAGAEGGSGSFEWRQSGDVTTLSLAGPLGAGAMRVTIAAGEPSIVDADGRALGPEATRGYLRERLGADVPWDELRYWMLGLPAPGSAAEVSEGAGDARRTIGQSGWQVGYSAYESAGGASLPTRFTATTGPVRLKVMVDRWSVPPGPGASP